MKPTHVRPEMGVIEKIKKKKVNNNKNLLAALRVISQFSQNEQQLQRF